jgi:hypothetical protein
MTEEIKKDKKKKVTKTVTKRGDKKPATKASRIFQLLLFQFSVRFLARAALLPRSILLKFLMRLRSLRLRAQPLLIKTK